MSNWAILLIALGVFVAIVYLLTKGFDREAKKICEGNDLIDFIEPTEDKEINN